MRWINHRLQNCIKWNACNVYLPWSHFQIPLFNTHFTQLVPIPEQISTDPVQWNVHFAIPHVYNLLYRVQPHKSITSFLTKYFNWVIDPETNKFSQHFFLLRSPDDDARCQHNWCLLNSSWAKQSLILCSVSSGHTSSLFQPDGIMKLAVVQQILALMVSALYG